MQEHPTLLPPKIKQLLSLFPLESVQEQGVGILEHCINLMILCMFTKWHACNNPYILTVFSKEQYGRDFWMTVWLNSAQKPLIKRNSQFCHIHRVSRDGVSVINLWFQGLLLQCFRHWDHWGQMLTMRAVIQQLLKTVREM